MTGEDSKGQALTIKAVVLHPSQFRLLVAARTGIKNPPPWLVCALAGMPYRPPVQ